MSTCRRIVGVTLVFLPLSLFAQAARQPAEAGEPRIERSSVDFDTVLRQVRMSALSPKSGAKAGDSIDASGNLTGVGGTVAVDGGNGSGVVAAPNYAYPSITLKLGRNTSTAQWGVFNSDTFPLIWSEASGASKMAIPSTFSATYGTGTAALTFWHNTNSNYSILDVFGGATGGNQLVKLANTEGAAYIATLGLYANGNPRSVLSASYTSPSYLLGTLAVGKTTVTTGDAVDIVGTLHADTITATNGINAVYQDVAEWVPTSEKIADGTVVVVNPDASNVVSPSSRPYQTSVAGVVSAKPGLLLGAGSAAKAKIATTGRVKVKVDAGQGAIHPGDLLVTSDKRGMAMKSRPISVGGVEIHRPGTLVGKALEPLESGEGEILVLLSLQ